jgi:glycosyltransferase involved in cell wall biosynthesis
MKINWFSPLPPAKTDIAHYTTRVLPALTQLAEVTLWTDQRQWDRSLKNHVEVRTFRLDRMPWAELNRADVNFYQIGNNPLFHSTIWQISRLHAGIVGLHDFRLHHFFDDIFRVQRRDLESYSAVMDRYYGEQGRRDAAESYYDDARNIGYMAERYPLTEYAVENQLGVVVHTQEAFDALAMTAKCPVVLAPLPFSTTVSSASGVAKPIAPPYRLIVFGYLGPNRRLNSVLRALAELREREQFQLDVYGDILDQGEELRALIRTLNLKQQVTLHGFAVEADLEVALSRAHLAINLRYPTMGEASGSQLRIWAHSLPALVSNVGWYASLPAETVAFVRVDENEIADIQSQLQNFFRNPDEFSAMGARGRELLVEEHAPSRYAKSLLELAERSRKYRSRISANRLAERAGVLMSEWLNPEAIGDAGANVAEEIYTLGNTPAR